MRWHEITVHTTEEAAEMIAHYFDEHGAGGVSIEESSASQKERDTSLGQWYEWKNDIPVGQVVIKGYFSEFNDIEPVLQSMQTAVRNLPEFGFDPGTPKWEVREVDEEDWANSWKQYYKPVRISPSITVKPTWEAYEPTEGELVIELDPGMAFGTGTHATTALCLRALERAVKPGDRVIDVGTGSGILAIAAGKLGAERVLALDLDPVAVTSASENAGLNHFSDLIEVRQSDLLGVIDQHTVADVVVANILAEIIVTFVDDVYAVLRPNGLYVASGIITRKEDDVVAALEKAGFIIEHRDYDSDWVAITARKP